MTSVTEIPPSAAILHELLRRLDGQATSSCGRRAVIPGRINVRAPGTHFIRRSAFAPPCQFVRSALPAEDELAALVARRLRIPSSRLLSLTLVKKSVAPGTWRRALRPDRGRAVTDEARCSDA